MDVHALEEFLFSLPVFSLSLSFSVSAWHQCFPQLGAMAGSFSKASSLVPRFGTDAHFYDDPGNANIASFSLFAAPPCSMVKRSGLVGPKP